MNQQSSSGTVYTDQPIFDAMAAATSIDVDRTGFSRIVLDAAKFIEVFNNHRDRALCTSINGAAQQAQQPHWRHKKRGTTYVEIGRGELQAEPSADLCEGDRMIAYRGDDGRVWFRREEEFEDGRFEAVAVPSTDREGK